MAHISIRNLSVEFKVYGSSARSFKRQMLSQATGGLIASDVNDVVTVKALNNVSLEIPNGDRIGLTGHNGSGKTTLLRTLAGIYKPTAGIIEIDGTIGALLDPASGMDAEATGIENIYLRGHVLGMSKKEINAKIGDISAFTELGKFLELPVKTYSAGMSSRLGFAISTSIRPDILLMDEGIGAGDSNFQKKASDRTHELFDKTKISLIATHSKPMRDLFCDRTIKLEHGSIVEENHT